MMIGQSLEPPPDLIQEGVNPSPIQVHNGLVDLVDRLGQPTLAAVVGRDGLLRVVHVDALNQRQQVWAHPEGGAQITEKRWTPNS